MRTLDRYTLREMAEPFAFCVAGFTIVLISGILFELTDLILIKNIGHRIYLRHSLVRTRMLSDISRTDFREPLPLAVLCCYLSVIFSK